jgi:hypothetical protein
MRDGYVELLSRTPRCAGYAESKTISRESKSCHYECQLGWLFSGSHGLAWTCMLRGSGVGAFGAVFFDHGSQSGISVEAGQADAGLASDTGEGDGLAFRKQGGADVFHGGQGGGSGHQAESCARRASRRATKRRWWAAAAVGAGFNSLTTDLVTRSLVTRGLASLEVSDDPDASSNAGDGGQSEGCRDATSSSQAITWPTAPRR